MTDQPNDTDQPPDPADVKPPDGLGGASAALRFSSLLPPPFRAAPDQSWEDWEEDFTSCAQLNHWDDAASRHVLQLRLQGPAREALRSLSPATKSQLATLLAALRDRFLPANHHEVKRSTFRLRTQRSDEGILAFGNAIRGLAAQAFPTMDIAQRDLLSRDQFLDGLRDGNLRLRVRYGNPKSLDDAIRIALEVNAAELAEERRRADGGQSIPTSTVPPSLIASAAPADTLLKAVEQQSTLLSSLLNRVIRLESPAHASFAVSSGVPYAPRSSVPLAERRCWNCGEMGHIRMTCTKFSAKHDTHQQCYPLPSRDEPLLPPFAVGALQPVSPQSAAVFQVDAMVNGHSSRCLLDSCAAVSIVPPSFAPTNIQQSTEQLSMASGHNIPVLGALNLPLTIGTWSTQHYFRVAPIATNPILGADFITQHDIDLLVSRRQLRLPSGFSHPLIAPPPPSLLPASPTPSSPLYSVVLVESVVFPPGQMEMIVAGAVICPDTKERCTSSSHPLLFEPSEQLAEKYDLIVAASLTNNTTGIIPVRVFNVGGQRKLYKGKRLGTAEEIDPSTLTAPISNTSPRDQWIPPLPDTPTLTPSQRAALETLLMEYNDIFSRHPSDLGRTNICQHRIVTTTDRPIHQRPYRQPFHLRAETNRQVQEMLDEGIITPSCSPWSSPVILVTKKNGKFRFCVDFRLLNDITVKDAYPIPRIDETLDSLGGALFFTTLDLASGYWQVLLAAEDRAKTAFSTNGGHFEFQVMPFGLTNAPATFQRLMDVVLRGLTLDSCLVYLDDVLVHSRTFEEHLCRLRAVFERLRTAGLKLRTEKCQFVRSEVPYLGHVVSAEGIATDPTKVDKVRNWPNPRTKTEVRSFINFAGYYRRFVPGFSTIAAPLHNLTTGHSKFTWTTEAERAFATLKEKLTEAPVLAFPRFSEQFRLKTDASDVGLGAVLSQIIDGHERPIAFASKKLSATETNYSATEKELLAIKWGTAHFHPYLLGAPFVVVTDHRPLVHLNTMKHPAGKVGRWLHTLSQYTFTVEYKPGRLHVDADALSRMCAVTTIPASANVAELRAMQEADDVLATVIARLRADEGRPPAEGVWRDGAHRRYRQLWDQLQLDDHNILRRNRRLGARLETTSVLVVPQALVPTILQQLHGDPLSGHLGVSKTTDTLLQRYYWPGFSADVDDYIRRCSTCQRANAVAPRPKAPLRSIPVGGPFEMMSIDFLELPRTVRGNRYVLVCTDYFTRWPEAFATADQKSETVARALYDGIVSRHGVPRILHSDQGPSFEGRVIRHLCQMMGLEKTRTTPYHPQGDGLVERFNRSLLGILRKYCGDRPLDWDLWLPSALHAYRVAKQTSTGASPFELLYGRKPRLPTDVACSCATPPPTDTSEYLQRLSTEMVRARELVDANLTAAQERQRQGVTPHVRLYSPGDLVYLHDPGRLRGKAYKLLSVWDGPFKILRKQGENDVYQIQHSHKGGRRRWVHHDRLRPCYQPIDAPHDETSSTTTTDAANDGQTLGTPTTPNHSQPQPGTGANETPHRTDVGDVTDFENVISWVPSGPVITPQPIARPAAPTPTPAVNVQPQPIVSPVAPPPDNVHPQQPPPLTPEPIGREDEPPERPRRITRLPVRFEDYVLDATSDSDEHSS